VSRLDRFYDGKNVDKQAVLRVKASQFVSRFEVSRPGTVLEVFAAIGGFASVALSALTVLIRLVDGALHYLSHRGDDEPVDEEAAMKPMAPGPGPSLAYDGPQPRHAPQDDEPFRGFIVTSAANGLQIVDPQRVC